MPDQGAEELARILVVEDERIVALDLASTLIELGYKVVATVATGEAALELADREPLDLVLMDIRLAGQLDGIETAARLKHKHDLAVIYLTSHSDGETLRRALGTHPLGYLVKPFRTPELRCAIEIALHRHEVDARLRSRQRWLAQTLRSLQSGATPEAPSSPALASALSELQGNSDVAKMLDAVLRELGDTAPPRSAAPPQPIGDGGQLERLVVARAEQLQAANRELEAFHVAIAHDLRAPLRGIAGFSQLLLEDHASNLGPEGVEHLHRVRAAARRMSELIEDLLSLARISTAPLTVSTVDVSALAAEIERKLQHGQQKPHVSFAIEPGIVLEGDAALVRTALDNLLSNAWKFTAKVPAPRVELTALVADGRRGCSVRDNGIGFDAAGHAARLFVPFQRFHPHAEFPGTGIGLAIVSRIVERHGGKLWVESSPGHGATFNFTL